MQLASGKSVDFTRYIGLLWKWKFLIIVPTIVFPLAAGYKSMQIQDRFMSSTLILVTPQKVPTNIVASTVTTGIEERLSTISQQIFSRTRLEQIIQEFNLFEQERQERAPEEIIALMRSRIELKVSRTNAFELSFVDANPRLAMLVTNKLTSLFIEENLKVREQQAIGTGQFLADEIERYREQIREKEKAIFEFKRQHMNELPEQLASSQSRLGQLQSQLQINTQNANAAEDRRVRLQQQLAEIERRVAEGAQPGGGAGGGEQSSLSAQLAALLGSESGGSPAAVDEGPLRALEGQIAERERVLEGMLLTVTEKHPDVSQLKAVIAKLQEKAAAERARIEAERSRLEEEREAEAASAPAAPDPEPVPDLVPQYPPVYASLKADLLKTETEIARIAAQNEEIQRSIEIYQRRISATPARQLQLQQISEDYDNIRAVMESLINKKLQADLSENMERKQKGEQFKILDPANLPEKPYSPNRRRYVAGGLVVGLGLGLGLVLLLDLLDFSVRSKDDLEGVLDAPVLTVIPEIRTAASLRRNLLLRLGAYGACAACLFLAVGIVHIKVKPIPQAVSDLYAQVRATHWTTIR
ncbi:MAG: Wzz/FepE/Etk N-terminal domain-containing protein [Deferrisomatales bacterium]|nr:Wzz/FepE/Etk N-terminal domain-containing protein [Deferrisomatales bacterium]